MTAYIQMKRPAPTTAHRGRSPQSADVTHQSAYGNAAQQEMLQQSQMQQVAARGIQGSGAALPFLDQIQASFGAFDISGVRAHLGGAAGMASDAMHAHGYAYGQDIALGGAPDLHTVAHEAAHTIQQQAGVSLSGGVGQSGDRYEQNADAVADKVVRGESAEPLLQQITGGRSGGRGAGVQMKAVQLDQWDASTGTMHATDPNGFDAAARQCQNQLNWSDAGHWQGTGPEPDCRKQETARSANTIVYHWADEQSMLATHAAANKSRERLGYFAGALTTVITAGANVVTGVLAGFGASKLCNSIPDLRDEVNIGDTLEIETSVQAVRSAHPWGTNEITFNVRWTLTNAQGIVKFNITNAQSLDLDGLSRSQVDDLFNAIKAGN